ncbi:MAG: hypothetical protein QM811_29310 [Pirellulales bacterium]
MLNRALDLQERSYRLLRWLADAVGRGRVAFETAHEYATLPATAERRIFRHYANLPEDARPAIADLSEFASFFTTYLINSFTLVATPGQRRFSPGAHCFCPWCSWLIAAPRLKTIKPTAADKKRARHLQEDALRALALEDGLVVDDVALETILRNEDDARRAALVAYGRDLPARLRGIARGPEILALWRAFAWSKAGSPLSGFRLTAELLIAAERALVATLRAVDSARKIDRTGL